MEMGGLPRHPAPNPNYLINGNFDIWQRGTTVTGGAESADIYATADMWSYQLSKDGGTHPTIIQSQQQITPGDLANSYYFYRVNVDGPGTGYGNAAFHRVLTRIEGLVARAASIGRVITVSFYARSSIPGKLLGLYFYQSFGTGGSGGAFINGSTFALNSSWTKYYLTVTIPDITGYTVTANNALQVWFTYMWGSTIALYMNATAAETYRAAGNIDLAQVKVEPGDMATSLVPNAYAIELVACQRYFQRFNQAAVANRVFGVGLATAATTAEIMVNLPSNMLKVPALTQKGGLSVETTAGAQLAVTSLTVTADRSGLASVFLAAGVAAGLVAGSGTLLKANADTAGDIWLDASLPTT